MTKRSFILQATLAALKAGESGITAADRATSAAARLQREYGIKFDEHEPSLYVPLPGDTK
jgi:hypothetical protein